MINDPGASQAAELGNNGGGASTAVLNPPAPERVRKVHIDKDGIRWSDIISLSDQPFIGTSPEIEAISSLRPDDHGSNTDVPHVVPGRPATFPSTARADCFASAIAVPTARRQASRSNGAPPTMGASILKNYLVA
ncbi:hypothetical protein [Bradyrhizobium sp.]|uniref:hypothetical protein n=1 Tax=Bradyrhizobium sp. TaxID=376 RepID=UPI003C6A83B0